MFNFVFKNLNMVYARWDNFSSLFLYLNLLNESERPIIHWYHFVRDYQINMVFFLQEFLNIISLHSIQFTSKKYCSNEEALHSATVWNWKMFVKVVGDFLKSPNSSKYCYFIILYHFIESYICLSYNTFNSKRYKM